MTRAGKLAKARQKRRTSKVRKRRPKANAKYKTAKAKRNSKKRNYNRRYLKMIAEVRLRDSYQCQMCGTKSSKLQAHHIREWAKNPSLRNKRINLISLCNTCHNSIRHNESRYVSLFTRKAKHNTKEFRRLKWTYEDLLKRDAVGQILPENFVPFKYLDKDEVKVKKAKEHYLSKLYRGIKSRCYNPRNRSYHRYGRRGIKMYQEWLDDRQSFIDWINENLGERPPNHSLDRKDNDGNYEPGNLRWASASEQRQNQSVKTLDPHVVLTIFILYHKYKFKQTKIQLIMDLPNLTNVRNVVFGKTYRNILYPYRSISILDEATESLNQYYEAIKDE